jgi:hypothetical protein
MASAEDGCPALTRWGEMGKVFITQAANTPTYAVCVTAVPYKDHPNLYDHVVKIQCLEDCVSKEPFYDPDNQTPIGFYDDLPCEEICLIGILFIGGSVDHFKIYKIEERGITKIFEAGLKSDAVIIHQGKRWGLSFKDAASPQLSEIDPKRYPLNVDHKVSRFWWDGHQFVPDKHNPKDPSEPPAKH